jgi:hypothetical protein
LTLASERYEMRIKSLVGKSDGNIPLGRRRRRWKDNIKMDLKEVE